MRAPRATRTRPTIPLASTADLAFLLLIFFIVLAKNTSEGQVEWRPAQTVVPLASLGDALVSVIIDKNQDIYINGQRVEAGGVTDTVNAYLGNRPQGERKVLLKVDKDIPARLFEQVMLDIGAAGGDLFRVLDPKAEEPKR